MALARTIEKQVDAEIDILRLAADERDATGKLTKAAKAVRQSLHNPSLSTTTIPVALRAMSKVRHRLLQEANDAHIALERATAEYGTARAALRWHDLKRELYEQDAPQPRKHTLSATEISAEEMTFLREMRKRGVPLSAMDQGNVYERDFIALFLKELAKPIDSRDSAGAWARTFSEGEVPMPVRSMTDDQVEALRLVYDPARDAAIEAKLALERAAGRELDISLNFALMLVAINEQIDLEELPGLQINIENAKRIAWQRDVAKILKALDLTAEDVGRARTILAGPPPFSHDDVPAATPASAASNIGLSSGEAACQSNIEFYSAAARAIVDDRISRLWESIKLPGGPSDIYQLETAAVRAVEEGLKLDYLDEIMRQADWQPDLQFVNDLIQREYTALASRLAGDKAFREQMRATGHQLPSPPEERS